MRAPEDHLRASEAAAYLGVSIKTLRLYEQRGLLAPLRSAAGWRLYGPADLARAAKILKYRAMGLSLNDISIMLEGTERDRRQLLEAHVSQLQGNSFKVAETIQNVRHHLTRLEPARGEGVWSHPRVRFPLPWPWDGEIFEVAPVRALNFITGPLGSGKTRLAIALAKNLPAGRFLGLDRMDDEFAKARAEMDADPLKAERIEEQLGLLIDGGAIRSWALIALLLALDASQGGALVVDMVEQALDAPTQKALVALVRRRPARGAPVFFMTRSNVILDMTKVGPRETLIMCPANHSVPFEVAPTPGARGYEAVMTCLASPDVRARTSGPVASSTSFLSRAH